MSYPNRSAMAPTSNLNQPKMAIEVEEALRRRRERGRKSQAGFRKRQAEATQHLQDQNYKLKNAIEKLVNATRGDEHPELLNTIFDVAEAAGIDAQRPATQNNANKLKSGRVSKNNQILTYPSDDKDEDITINLSTGNFTLNATSSQESSNSSLTTLSSTPSQRLTCGIWMNPVHYMRVSIPPDDIVPYLGPGSNTFAGILFWSVMDHSQNKCKRHHGDFAFLTKRALRHSSVTQDWAIEYIQAMVEARQEYKRTGSISSQYAAAAEPDLAMVVCDRVEAEYYSRGMDPNQWLSCLGIEKHIRGMLGAGAFAVLERVAKGGRGCSPALRDLFEITECKLAETCICFGDGPRWSVDIVDGLFLGLVHAASCSTL